MFPGATGAVNVWFVVEIFEAGDPDTLLATVKLVPLLNV
jgi:hypothetical protein